MLLLHTGPLRHRQSTSASLMDLKEITSGFTRGRGGSLLLPYWTSRKTSGFT